jgi:hypothetical protein
MEDKKNTRENEVYGQLTVVDYYYGNKSLIKD